MQYRCTSLLAALGLALAAVLALAATGCRGDDAPPPLPRVLDDAVRAYYDGAQDSLVRRAYEAEGWTPLWLTDDGPTPEARALLRQLCQAEREGLPRTRYRPQALIDTLRAAFVHPPEGDTRRADSLRQATRAAADLALTRAFLRYAHDLTVGRLDPGRLPTPDSVQGTWWHVEQDRAHPVEVLRRAQREGIRRTLDAVAAQHIHYAPLRDALQRYRTLADEGGWPTLPEAAVPLERGDAGPAVAALRVRLAATDDLQAPAPADSSFDGAVVRAVKHAQTRHGLDATGIVDDATRQALNVSAHQRARQLALNLERHRWLPENLGQDFIFVNLMDFRLNAYRDGEEAMEMPVIVGETDKQTAAFADTMRYVIFGPYWNIPKSIAIDEILPKVRRDPGYLARNDYEIVNAAGEVVDASLLSEDALQRYEVRLREQPGPGNALGLVKFMFPNDHDIYLHDTPADHLFDATTRTFSHGCVRVERPVDFASFVLPEAWTPERVREAMNAGERRRVPLKTRMPVFLVYLTAWAEPGGPVHFRRDLYDHDPTLHRALDAPGPRPNACARLDALLQHVDEAAQDDDDLLTRVTDWF